MLRGARRGVFSAGNTLVEQYFLPKPWFDVDVQQIGSTAAARTNKPRQCGRPEVGIEVPFTFSATARICRLFLLLPSIVCGFAASTVAQGSPITHTINRCRCFPKRQLGVQATMKALAPPKRSIIGSARKRRNNLEQIVEVIRLATQRLARTADYQDPVLRECRETRGRFGR